jgi:chromosome segregation ATPase
MDMLKSKEGLAEEVKSLRSKLQSSREQNSVLSDQLLLLQKECKNLLNSISGYEETNHKLSTQVARLNEKNIHLKKKLKQAVTACADIKKQAESYISSIQSRFYEQMSRMRSRPGEDSEGSFSAFNHSSPFKYDSPAISVSERENDSSIARFDSEEIIMAYTQEIRDKQTEISALTKSLETKTIDLENFKMNMKTLRDNFEKRMAEKEKSVASLQQEVRVLHDEISSLRKEPRSNEEKEVFSRSVSEDYVGQVEVLQNKLANQSKKFENYIRTIANLEKQIQLQMIRASELENNLKSSTDSLQGLEQEKASVAAALLASEARVNELESLKIQQAKVINDQSARLSTSRHMDETQAVSYLKRTIEGLEDDNKKLIEANSYIQNYADSIKKSKDSEILALKLELSKTQEDSPALNKSLSENKENPYNEVILFCVQTLEESEPNALKERLKSLLRSRQDNVEDARHEIVSVFKEFSNKNLTLIAKISNAMQKVNERLGDFLLKLGNKVVLSGFKERFQVNQIRSYEITTVNECSEKEDESFEEDSLEIKLEQSARRIKELNSEVSMVKDLLEQKDDLIHDLELKSDRFRIDKEKRQKENNELHMKIAELENELRTNKEVFEIADKKKTAMINTLENRISNMKKEMEVQKSAIISEKEELFDHIIRIEQESKTQTSWFRSQLDELKSKQKSYESILESIESFLGNDFNGDHLESIKNITSKKRRNSFSFKIFRKSSTKSESGSKNGTPTGSEVLSPSASGTASVDYMKIHKALEQEKLHNLMHVQQIEALRENIRHLEYENSRNTDNKIYQNLRNLVIEILKMLPVMYVVYRNEGVERKIQIVMALLWLSSEEKLEIDHRRARGRDSV